MFGFDEKESVFDRSAERTVYIGVVQVANSVRSCSVPHYTGKLLSGEKPENPWK